MSAPQPSSPVPDVGAANLLADLNRVSHQLSQQNAPGAQAAARLLDVLRRTAAGEVDQVLVVSLRDGYVTRIDYNDDMRDERVVYALHRAMARVTDPSHAQDRFLAPQNPPRTFA